MIKKIYLKISSPYLSFGVEELTRQLKPNYIFFNLRNPIQTVESFLKKGWYLNFNNQNNVFVNPTNNTYISPIDNTIKTCNAFTKYIKYGDTNTDQIDEIKFC